MFSDIAREEMFSAGKLIYKRFLELYTNLATRTKNQNTPEINADCQHFIHACKIYLYK